MNRLRFLLLLLAGCLLLSGYALAAADGLKVTELAVTTKVAKGKPVDAVHRISASSVKSLYCFSRVVGAAGETTVRHVWYRNNDKVKESELPVKGAHWRVWSQLTVNRESPGNWRVEVQSADGRLLKKVEFRIN